MWRRNTEQEVVSITGVLTHFCLGFTSDLSMQAPPTFPGILSGHGSRHHGINLVGNVLQTISIMYSLSEKIWIEQPNIWVFI